MDNNAYLIKTKLEELEKLEEENQILHQLILEFLSNAKDIFNSKEIAGILHDKYCSIIK